MPQKFKVQKLLRNKDNENSYLDYLTISPAEDTTLKQCRRDIRAALREGFNELQIELIDDNNTKNSVYSKLKPKFMTQGSYEYGTLNSPALTPPQQIDLDDGVYFPMELLNNRPKAIKNALLQHVESILTALANRKNWNIQRKSTCIRLNVSSKIHIDIPVYAIPDEKYQLMIANCNFEAVDIRKVNFHDESTRLDPSEVYLARWDEDDWIQSDPKQLHDWFSSKARQHGRILKPVCRYIKSWRDNRWIKGGPTSITLMTAVVSIFDEHLQNQRESFNSDCRALLEVAHKLPNQFSRKIFNPVLPESELFPANINIEQVEEIQIKVRELSQNIIDALCYSEDESEVLEKLIVTFGNRIPYKPEWIERLSISEVVKSVPKYAQAAPRSFSKTHRSG